MTQIVAYSHDVSSYRTILDALNEIFESDPSSLEPIHITVNTATENKPVTE